MAQENSRDPRLDPKPGDILKRWGIHLVLENQQGCVFTQPSLSAHKEWVGILFFREWATNAEVIHRAE